MTDEYYMQIAIEEAKKAFANDEVPIGCVIVSENRIIAKSHNCVEQLNDPTAHAEIIAITQASNVLNSKYLKNTTLYVTIEPCLMCMGAILWSKIDRVVYGVKENKSGYSLFIKGIINLNTDIKFGVLSNECRLLMEDFFSLKRKKINKR